MKIAFHRPHHFFLDIEAARLKERLAAHDFFDWFPGDEAPAADLDLLLIVGALDRETIAKQAQLFFIQTATAGYDGVDVDAATDSGIWVSFARAGETGNAISVAEHGVMLMIGASRRLNRAIASVRDHGLTANHLATALHGKTACVVGLGAIGRALVDRLLAFGMTLRGTDEHPESAPHGVEAFPTNELHRAVHEADYVIVCAPGSKANEHLIDAATLAKMKDGAILINVARGMLVDETRLRRLCKAGISPRPASTSLAWNQPIPTVRCSRILKHLLRHILPVRPMSCSGGPSIILHGAVESRGGQETALGA